MFVQFKQEVPFSKLSLSVVCWFYEILKHVQFILHFTPESLKCEM